jgi:GNAT superfamily N-acetyltransferase
VQYEAFDPGDRSHVQAAAAIWTQACGPELAVSPRFVRYHLSPPEGVTRAGRLAVKDGEPIGFVLASVMRDRPQVMPPQAGWIDAIAVRPASVGQGIGGGLLAWAEDWLAGQGCAYAALGGSIKWFTPGLPASLGSDGFFTRRGFGPFPDASPGHDLEWDVARSLRDYVTPVEVRVARDVRVAPVEPGEEGAVREFLQREFPGRWLYEFEEFLREGGRIGDFVALWSARGVEGCAHLTYEDSLVPLDHYFPYRLSRPWGQLGAIGVSADCRGLGYGGALLDGGLRILRERGVDGCVIDWTTIVDFYGKFGFKFYREFRSWGKGLGR